jgi:hypothetical protein
MSQLDRNFEYGRLFAGFLLFGLLVWVGLPSVGVNASWVFWSFAAIFMLLEGIRSSDIGFVLIFVISAGISLVTGMDETGGWTGAMFSFGGAFGLVFGWSWMMMQISRFLDNKRLNLA